MKDIRLKGLKILREIKGVTQQKLAMDINLLNDTGINFVLTSEYINKIESRKQSEIDDKLIQILVEYFDTTVEKLIDYETNEDILKQIKSIFPCKRSIDITHYIQTNKSGNKLLTKTLFIDERIDDDFIELALKRLLQPFSTIKDEDDFNTYVQLFEDLAEEYKNELDKRAGFPLVGSLMEEFIDDYILHRIHNEVYEIGTTAAILFKHLKTYGLTDTIAMQLTHRIIDSLLQNGYLM